MQKIFVVLTTVRVGILVPGTSSYGMGVAINEFAVREINIKIY